ncbi:uncharacterized protein LOC113794180 isoform X2 [Dermatophagoides pteronyssinus]|uniref:Uncharacterized protein DDB_G0286379-like isoform X2 n=1 Tax=Dermatophagoides pteronyssinus TaxID=6956 RepID=A0A6P6Y3L3_DERPT|nr:uncharacterized protein DDB_G0286379-like isoform X2 [Dermatophagoides pteronyssinus]
MTSIQKTIDQQQHSSIQVVRTKNMENEEDNPFRPGSELSREADIIVNLIKEGKPITPTGDIVAATSANNSNVAAVNNNNNSNSQTPQKQKDEILTKQQTHLVSKNPDDKDGPINKIHNKSNNNNNNMEPGQIEIQHGIIVANNVDNNMTTVEQINLKKKRKCCSLI